MVCWDSWFIISLFIYSFQLVGLINLKQEDRMEVTDINNLCQLVACSGLEFSKYFSLSATALL